MLARLAGEFAGVWVMQMYGNFADGGPFESIRMRIMRITET